MTAPPPVPLSPEEIASVYEFYAQICDVFEASPTQPLTCRTCGWHRVQHHAKQLRQAQAYRIATLEATLAQVKCALRERPVP